MTLTKDGGDREYDKFVETSNGNTAIRVSIDDAILLQSLIETLQELIARLNVINSMANSGAPALRVIPISSVSTAVSGSLTTVTNLTNFGTGVPAKEVSDDMNNILVTLANINNVTG